MSSTTLNVKPVFQGTIKTSGITFVNADGTTPKVLATALADGSTVNHVSVTSDEVGDIVLALQINDGVTDFDIGQVIVPAGAGTNAGVTSAFNLLDASKLILQENGSLLLQGTYTLKVFPTAAITAAKTVTLVADYGEY